MYRIIEPNHSQLNLIGSPVVTTTYTDASPVLAADTGSSLATNGPGAARAAAPSVARAAAITAVPRAAAMAFGLELQNAFDYPDVHRGGLAARRVLYLHSAEGVVSVFRQYEAAALARFARVLHVASYRHGPVRADYEVFSRAGPADTRPRSSSWLSAETSQEHREQGAAESNAASGRVLARGRVRQVPRGVQTREWATAEAKAGAGETPVAQTCEATVAEAKTGIGEMPSPARPSL